MKKYILFFYLILLNFANSEQKIAYIDMKKILNTSTVGINLTKEIEKKINKENKKFNLIEEQLKKEEKDLSQKKNILSKDEFTKKLSSLKQKVDIYNKDKNNSLKNVNQIKINKTSKLINKINPIIANYASDKNISIIIRKDSMIMGKTELDISSDIINLINKNIKE
tara:strand:- start:262 stop:762 length:501 start_codon:yes stop_codon:yes gene_type:complete